MSTGKIAFEKLRYIVKLLPRHQSTKLFFSQRIAAYTHTNEKKKKNVQARRNFYPRNPISFRAFFQVSKIVNFQTQFFPGTTESTLYARARDKCDCGTQCTHIYPRGKPLQALYIPSFFPARTGARSSRELAPLAGFALTSLSPAHRYISRRICSSRSERTFKSWPRFALCIRARVYMC